MCNSGLFETPEHIILHCLFAKSIWSLTLYADLIEQDSDSNISLQDWITKWITDNNLKDKVGVVFNFPGHMERQMLLHIFQGKSLNHHSTTRLALKLVNDT